MWKAWAGVDGTTTSMFSSAHSCRKRSRRAELCSGPALHSRAAAAGQAGNAAPLGFTGGDELVDHHLGTVGEVAELAFPDARVFGSVVEPYSKAITASSLSSESMTVAFSGESTGCRSGM
jgi:hypothetical protein